MNRLLILLALIGIIACSSIGEPTPETSAAEQGGLDSIPEKVIVGAERTGEYLPFLKDKNIALVVNQTSTIGNTHLADSLLSLGISIAKIFAPEHGFRGDADAGEKVVNGVDLKTGISIHSLYGKSRKPSKEDLAGIEVIVFDIQDVGARFYTYISTMSYIMESCAENSIGFIILDRPNPLGFYVDGPVLDEAFQSFVGMHRVPIVHGMTIGEYATMVNSEGWLQGRIPCSLKVVACENYDHGTFYELPIKPSPNLPNMRSIYFYPSICLFEGTEASEGRGTNRQFQVVGSPSFIETEFQFTPVSMPGAKHPKHENKLCFGFDYSSVPIEELQQRKQIDLEPILSFYRDFPNKEKFFLKNLFFDKLAGNDQLRNQIISGKTENEIRDSWKEKLDQFRAIRKKYLLYPDFE